MSRTLTPTTVRTFRRVLATAERLLERIDNLEGRMTREEIALLRRVLDGDAVVPDGGVGREIEG